MSFLLNSFRYVSADTGPAFHALTPDTDNDYTMEGVLVGTGDLTTSHTSTLYAPDKDGVYQQFPANAEVWSGGRCVLSGSPEAGSDVSSVHGNESSGGAPLAEVPYLQYYPAAENKALYSNNLTEAGWSDVANVVTTYDQIGMTGEPNTASLVTDNSAADTSYVSYTTLPLTGSTRQLTNVFYVKKDTDETVFPWFYQTTGLGGNLGVLLNKNTGATSITTDTTTNPSAEAVDAGDWWKLMLSQEISGSGNIGYRVYPARTDIWGSGTADPALTAAVTIGNVEVYDGKTIAEVRGLGPIFTTTAAVATDATVYRFDTSNYGGDDVAWFTELNWPNASEGYTRLSLPGATGNAVILGNTSANNSRIFGYKKFAYIVGSETTPNCQISDGTTQLEKSKWGLVNSVTDGEATMETDLLSGGLQVSPSVVCTVTAPSDKLILAPIAGWEDGSCSIRNIQRYDITSYAEGKDIIDGLMA